MKKFVFSLTSLGWIIACVVVFIGGVTAWFISTPKRPSPTDFGKVLQVYSFKPEVTATTYNSKLGDATIIWLSGMEEHPAEFGQIWRVYSFSPGVIATIYDSSSAGASIIWLSGMDDEETPRKKTSS